MIPIAKPSLTGLEKRYLNEALASTWISSSGEFLDRFETEFASSVAGTDHALAVTNGTVALHLALAALGVGPGDEVIVPSLTYVATANAVRYLGASPVFADVTSDSWCIDPQAIASLITSRTVGVIAVHLYGHSADMDAINAVARAAGLWVVEDAAEAPFATYKGRPTGGLGDIATFSFYGNKVLTSGEGGAVTTNSADLADRMRLLRGQGMDPKRRYFFPVVGYNFRMTNLSAALLVAQLERSVEILAARHHVYEQYRQALSGVPGLRFQPRKEWAQLSPWLFCVLIDASVRQDLVSSMNADGIETRPFFIPIHTLPPHAGSGRGPMAVTERLADEGINLPTYPDMSDEDVALVAGSLIAALVR